eukprot:3210262-Prymnesium_polylepis.1
MISQHSPITQGSAHLPEARATPWCRRPSPPRPLAAATQSVGYMRIALIAWFGWGGGSPSRRAPTRTACVPTWTASAP